MSNASAALARKSTSLVTEMRLRTGAEQAFAAWHANMCTIPAQLPGFISAEVTAPSAVGPPLWRIVQHFASEDQLRAWRQSEQHRRLLAEAESLVDNNGGAGLHEEQASDAPRDGTVTQVVATYVRPDKAEEYKTWAAKAHAAEAQFPGYRGGFLQPPSAANPCWTTLVRFATPEQLDAWLTSSERDVLLCEHKALVSSWAARRLPTSFAGWFPEDQAAGARTPEWKQSLVVILMLFPIVMLEIRFLGPLTHGLSTSLGTFIGNVLSVFLLMWPFMPLAIRALKWWLVPAEDRASWLTPAGTLLLLALYAVEIALLSRLVS